MGLGHAFRMTQKGPGKHYRRGISLVEIMRRFPDDRTAHDWFARARWPAGPRCPRCGMANVLVGTAHRSMPYRCRPCRRYFSVKTGTVMEDSKLGCRIWAVAIYLLTTGLKGQSSMKLHRDLGITQKTAWHLAHRIRQSWARGAPAFSGPVETDETFIGGRMHNMSKARRAILQAEDSSGKTIVVGAKDRDTNEVAAAVVPDTARTTLRGFLRRHVEPGAVLYTDEHAAYRGIPDFRHATVRRSRNTSGGRRTPTGWSPSGPC